LSLPFIIRPINVFNVDNRYRFFLVFGLGFTLVCAAPGSRAAEVRQVGDTNITVVLSSPASVRELLANHFEVPGVLADDTARAAFMRRARREIGELLATEGYYSPTLKLQPAGLDGVRKLEVEPGPRTLVSRLDIEFRGDLAADAAPECRARIDKVRAAWSLGTGAPFRSSAWEEAKASLLASVASEDFAAAQIVDSRAEVDPATATAQLNVVIDSGPAFRFGELEVSGLERYERDLLLRQMPFQPGAPYRRDLLLSFQTRLQSMPQFSSVIVEIEPDISTHAAAPVKVALLEAKTRRVAIGVGISTDNGPRSEINYLDHDFFDRAWSLNAGLKLEQNRQNLSAGIDTLPDDDGYLLSWGAATEATLIAGLKTERHKLSGTRSRTLGPIETRLGVNWQQETRRPSGGVQEVNQALVLDWQWHRRAIDNPLYPRDGSVTELRLGGGSRQLLSDHDFLRSYARHEIWWPLAERDVVSMRGEVGYTRALSRLGIPQEYLFRAGGSQSVRGYTYQSLGVIEGTAIVGGRALLTGSLEYTHWFSQDWGGALFADTGGVADALSQVRMVSGYGIGVRWRSPVGPLAMDMAWGQQSNDLQLHFSLAAAF
jgi:translocation and assembly module TamA